MCVCVCVFSSFFSSRPPLVWSFLLPLSGRVMECQSPCLVFMIGVEVGTVLLHDVW